MISLSAAGIELALQLIEVSIGVRRTPSRPHCNSCVVNRNGRIDVEALAAWSHLRGSRRECSIAGCQISSSRGVQAQQYPVRHGARHCCRLACATSASRAEHLFLATTSIGRSLGESPLRSWVPVCRATPDQRPAKIGRPVQSPNRTAQAAVFRDTACNRPTETPVRSP